MTSKSRPPFAPTIVVPDEPGTTPTAPSDGAITYDGEEDQGAERDAFITVAHQKSDPPSSERLPPQPSPTIERLSPTSIRLGATMSSPQNPNAYGVVTIEYRKAKLGSGFMFMLEPDGCPHRERFVASSCAIPVLSAPANVEVSQMGDFQVRRNFGNGLISFGDRKFCAVLPAAQFADVSEWMLEVGRGKPAPKPVPKPEGTDEASSGPLVFIRPNVTQVTCSIHVLGLGMTLGSLTVEYKSTSGFTMKFDHPRSSGLEVFSTAEVLPVLRADPAIEHARTGLFETTRNHTNDRVAMGRHSREAIMDTKTFEALADWMATVADPDVSAAYTFTNDNGVNVTVVRGRHPEVEGRMAHYVEREGVPVRMPQGGIQTFFDRGEAMFFAKMIRPAQSGGSSESGQEKVDPFGMPDQPSGADMFDEDIEFDEDVEFDG